MQIVAHDQPDLTMASSVIAWVACLVRMMIVILIPIMVLVVIIMVMSRYNHANEDDDDIHCKHGIYDGDNGLQKAIHIS